MIHGHILSQTLLAHYILPVKPRLPSRRLRDSSVGPQGRRQPRLPARAETPAIVQVDPVKFPGIPPRSATREQFLASAKKAGYLLEKEETFLIHDNIYVLRPKREA